MVDKLGDLTRSYWPVVVSIVTAVFAWGVLYGTVNSTAAEVHELVVTVRRFEVALAGADERQKFNASRIAELSERVRSLEQLRR